MTPTDPTPTKRPAHRPKGSTRTDRTAVIPAQRATPEERETWDALGGMQYLRPLLAKEREKMLRKA